MASNATLYLVIAHVEDVRRRRMVAQTLAYAGRRVAARTWEVATPPAGMAKLLRAIALDIEPDDRVRVYPVCGRCQRGVILHGDDGLEQLPAAWIF